MNAKVTWTEGMAFTAETGGASYTMDAKRPLGTETGATPKEFVAAAICGCTAMDVAALLKKYKQNFRSLVVSAEIESTSGSQPVVFKNVNLLFDVEGEIEPEKLKEAVHLSQTKFCGVSAMIAKVAPIHYTIRLNGESLGQGQAEFSI